MEKTLPAKNIKELLKEIKANNRDLIATQYNLDARGKKVLREYMRIYPTTYQEHIYQWWLWNSKGGKEQRTDYVNWLESEK